jgi:hypothetical protein
MPHHPCDHCGAPEEFSILCADCEAICCSSCGRVECCCDDRPQLLRHAIVYDVLDDSTRIVSVDHIWAWGYARLIASGSPEAMRALKRLYGFERSPLGTQRWVIQ